MAEKDPLTKKTSPSQKEVSDFHTNADTDGGPKAKHHTLGANPNQSSPGNHTHDGGSSTLLLEGTTISGSRGGNAAVASIIAALVKLGATDATSA